MPKRHKEIHRRCVLPQMPKELTQNLLLSAHTSNMELIWTLKKKLWWVLVDVLGLPDPGNSLAQILQFPLLFP